MQAVPITTTSADPAQPQAALQGSAVLSAYQGYQIIRRNGAEADADDGAR